MIPPHGATAPIRTILVEDIDETRHRLHNELARDPRVFCVGSARTLADGLKLVAEQTIDVALIDLGLPDGSGLELIRKLAELQPDADAMVISVFGEEDTVIQAIEAGATGYLIKGNLDLHLVDAVLQLRAGGSPISPVIARRLLKRFADGGAPAPAPLSRPAVAAPHARGGDAAEPAESLTERELDVLKLVAQGYVVAEIAERLHISPHTVSTHVKRTYRKLQVRSRGQAVSEAIRRGLL